MVKTYVNALDKEMHGKMFFLIDRQEPRSKALLRNIVKYNTFKNYQLIRLYF